MHTPFPISNLSIVPCLVLIVTSLPAYRYLGRQISWEVVWYSHLFQNYPQFAMIHPFKSFSIVNEVEVDVFLEFSCYFSDPIDVGKLTAGSSVFSKSSLNIWKFSVHVLLKPSLKNFEHYFASMRNEPNW